MAGGLGLRVAGVVVACRLGLGARVSVRAGSRGGGVHLLDEMDVVHVRLDPGAPGGDVPGRAL